MVHSFSQMECQILFPTECQKMDKMIVFHNISVMFNELINFDAIDTDFKCLERTVYMLCWVECISFKQVFSFFLNIFSK